MITIAEIVVRSLIGEKQDELDATSLCRSGCYMGYKSGDEDLCFKLDKDGNYRCKLMREIDSINGKIENAMDGK